MKVPISREKRSQIRIATRNNSYARQDRKRQIFFAHPKTQQILSRLSNQKRVLAQSLADKSVSKREITLTTMALKPKNEYLPFLLFEAKMNNALESPNTHFALAQIGFPEVMLYRDALGREEFFNKKRSLVRVKQRKSGDTTLLGGRLARKVVIKYLSKESYSAWLKALESKRAWRDAGFDYVPIEPILKKGEKYRATALSRTQTNQKNKYTRTGRTQGDFVRVSTRVIKGLTIQDYLNFVGFLQENKIIDKKTAEERRAFVMDGYKRISDTLNQLNINHGHLHAENILVTLSKDKPRLYAIDFDMAK